MNKRLVRELLVLLLILLFVMVARMWLYNLLFSIGMGVWAMIKLFPLIFRFAQNPENLTVDKFIPEPRRQMFDLLFASTRKDTFLVLIWWSSGILIAVLIYKLLTLILIS